MIRVKLDLLSARSGETSDLGTMYISNDGLHADHPKRGNYKVVVKRKNSDKILREGTVENFPRQNYNIWRLVFRALSSAFPEEGRKFSDLIKHDPNLPVGVPLKIDEKEHVLLRDDLEPAFNEDDMLEEMAAMDKERKGDWSDHIPYAAARDYNDKMCDLYGGHVNKCTYCQRLIMAIGKKCL